jgi:hypothetical protein
MNTVGNGFKAVIIVLGTLALIGLIYVLSPLLAALGSGLLVILGLLLPILVIALAIGLVFRYLQGKDEI